MKKTALIFSFKSNKTRRIAEKIASEFSEGEITKINADALTEEEFLSYDMYILGVPTWFDGELPHYWDEWIPALEEMSLNGKTFALFGLGDQKGYPENFADGIGIMAKHIADRGGKIIGSTSTDDYTFESSAALDNGRFLGLVIDQENQPRMTTERVKKWVADIKKHFIA
jgi:flavodoxin I